MGNILRSGGLLSNGGTGYDPYHVQLGRYTSISLSERQVMRQQNGGLLEMWNMTYEVGASTCALQLTIALDNTKKVKGIFLQLRSLIRRSCGAVAEFDFVLDSRTIDGDADYFLVYPQPISGFYSPVTHYENKKFNSKSGTVTDIDMYMYGEGQKGGLILLERKKKSEQQPPFEVIMAHYHVTSSGINPHKMRPDFGLSMFAKIRSIRGSLTITVDGPEQHPSSALLYMFDEVIRHAYWHRDMCPHCAKHPKKQNGELCESEESEGGSGKDNSRLISNGGKFGGDGNGNFYERNTFNNMIYPH
ncbi:hypothetical protein DEO72_LG5g125 [Vigna unguiculata]|uniref:Uncharacterized protein n=1 Tax=Vigna unguiculata TaxID=3917 RepID=A0A4D6LU31_VIGUN|nr:hypothetical protein DEO72_LG5g125 [Vigna unguiculata]